MNKIVFLLLLSLVAFSCERGEDLPPNPAWLNDMISQMENANPGTSITAYKWGNEYYYLVSDPVSSCLFCTFYSYSGDLVTWTDEKISDFERNGTKIRVIWQKRQ